MTEQDIADLVPHSGEMVLLDTVLQCSETSLTAHATVRADGLFNAGPDQVPSFISVEYMAQAVAAWAGKQGLERGDAVQPGLLLGVRDFKSDSAYLTVNDTLEVHVGQVMQTPAGLAVFDASCRGKAANISARLSVLTVKSLDEMRKLARSEND